MYGCSSYLVVGESQRQKLFHSHNKDHEIYSNDNVKNTKREMHKDTERRRRQEMATLFTSLRNLLPIEYIKGKRAVSDHVLEAAKYIKDLEKTIKELDAKKEELIDLSNLNIVGLTNEKDVTNKHICSNASSFLVVRSCLVGIEVVVNVIPGEKFLHLSKLLEVLIEEGLDVVSCVTTKVEERLIYTIQSEVGNLACVDTFELRNKVTAAILSLRDQHSDI